MREFFPILQRPDFRLPWALIAPHEAQALNNHGQTLEKLAYRGGLSFEEAAAVMEDRRWSAIKWAAGHELPTDPAEVYLERLIAQRTAPPCPAAAVADFREQRAQAQQKGPA